MKEKNKKPKVTVKVSYPYLDYLKKNDLFKPGEEKITCKSCKASMSRESLKKNYEVCPKCQYHYPVNAMTRISQIADEKTFSEIDSEITSADPLKFFDLKSYEERLFESKMKTGLNEAIICGRAKIGGYDVVLAVMDFRFMGGSMGSAVGEKIKRSVDLAIKEKIPLIIFCASGGARMQEGILSLMQMAKTVCSIQRLQENKIPYISILTNPTTGGVSASFATLADVLIAEPGALICFAGPRVIKQTIGKDLPDDFGIAESNLKNGQVDMVVSRLELKEKIALLLKIFYKAKQNLRISKSVKQNDILSSDKSKR
jgi:acetyl-CoA carboxylase carboxyl transferase subunit beta